MKNFKHKLWEITRYGASGETNLKEGIEKIVDTYGCTLLKCTKGYGVISLDYRKFKVSAGSLVIFIGECLFIPIETSKNFHAYYISVSTEQTDEMFYNVPPSFWDLWYRFPVLSTTHEQNRLLEYWFIQTDWAINHCSIEQAKDIVRNNFYNLFIAIDNEIRMTGVETVNDFAKNRSWKLYNDFYMLLDRHHMRHHNVKFYADQLNITPDYLYKLIHHIEDISPKELIDRMLVVDIKMLLHSTDLSVKNIATELHFEDPPYLCRFFRRMTGMSPIQFRNNKKKP